MCWLRPFLSVVGTRPILAREAIYSLSSCLLYISDLLSVNQLIFCLSVNRCSVASVLRSAALLDSRAASVCFGVPVWVITGAQCASLVHPPLLPIHSLFCLPPVRCECRVATGGDGEPGSRSYPAAQQHQRRCTAMVQVPPHSLFSLVALFVVLFGFMWIRAAKLVRPVDEGERWNQLAHGCAVDLWCETWSRSCLRLIRVRFSLWIPGLGLVCLVDYWFGVTCVYVCRIQEVWAGMCQIFDGWNLVAFEACFPLPPLPHYYPQSVTSCSWQSYPIFLVEFL